MKQTYLFNELRKYPGRLSFRTRLPKNDDLGIKPDSRLLEATLLVLLDRRGAVTRIVVTQFDSRKAKIHERSSAFGAGRTWKTRNIRCLKNPPGHGKRIRAGSFEHIDLKRIVGTT